MKKVTILDVKRLIATRAAPSISIYMNVDRRAPGGPDDRSRLRALLRRASALLSPALGRSGVDAMLTPIAERARQAWPDARSVAFLRSPEANESFALPVDVPELAIVSSTFHTKPLVTLLDGGDAFAVLGIGRGVARLYEGTRDALELVGDAAPGRPARPASGQAWYRAVDASVRRRLGDTERPLVLAGERRYAEAFRFASRYPRLLREAIECDLAQVHGRDLLAPTLSIVEAHRAEVETEAAVRYLTAAAKGGATEDLATASRAAVIGRIPLLVHRRGAHVWGRLDRISGEVAVRAGTPGPGDADLIDDLCELVLQQGGDVVELAAERMPCRAPVGAVVRAALTVPTRPTKRPEQLASA